MDLGSINVFSSGATETDSKIFTDLPNFTDPLLFSGTSLVRASLSYLLVKDRKEGRAMSTRI